MISVSMFKETRHLVLLANNALEKNRLPLIFLHAKDSKPLLSCDLCCNLIWKARIEFALVCVVFYYRHTTYRKGSISRISLLSAGC